MSPHLRAFLEAHRGLLAADLCLSADGGQVAEHSGGILLGLRGISSMQVDVVTAGTDMHSRMTGGSVPNPNHVSPTTHNSCKWLNLLSPLCFCSSLACPSVLLSLLLPLALAFPSDAEAEGGNV